MKKSLITLLFALTFTLAANAQKSTLVIFSEDGFPFKIMLNGMFQNQNPETNVRINNLAAAPYKLKIFFKDTANGTLVDQVYIEPGMEQVYVLKKKAISDATRSAKKFGEEWKSNWNMQSKEEAAAKQAEIDKKRERFVLRKQSVAQIAPPASTSTPAPSNTQTKAQPATRTSSASANVSGSSTTTTSSTQVTSSSTAVNTNTGNLSMSVSVNANVPAYYESSTTTTTTSTSTGGSNVVYLAGYNGPVGCPVPMNEGEFSSVQGSIASKTFEDSKLTMAKQVISSNCLLSSQVRDIMVQFTFENTRLELAKFAYGHTYDIGNYYKLNDAFQFETSIDELNEYVNSRRK